MTPVKGRRIPQAATRPETGRAAMVGIIMLVGITTLTGAQTAFMTWLGIAVLLAGGVAGWASWKRWLTDRQKPETEAQSNLEKIFNLLINAALLGILTTMVLVLTIKHTTH